MESVGYGLSSFFHPALLDFKPKRTKRVCKLWDKQLLIHIAMRREQIEIQKIPKFGDNRASFD